MPNSYGFEGQSCYWLCTFYSAFVTLILALSVTWMIIFPQELKFTITDAWLEEFDLSRADNKTLTYNFAVNITVKNPNNKIRVFFDRVKLTAKYRKKSFANTILSSTTPLHRGHNNITLHSILRGSETMNFSRRDERQHRSKKGSRVYEIDVKIFLVVRTKYGKVKSGQFKPPRIDCDRLKVPLRSRNTHDVNIKHFKPRVCSNVFVLFSPDLEDDLTVL